MRHHGNTSGRGLLWAGLAAALALVLGVVYWAVSPPAAVAPPEDPGTAAAAPAGPAWFRDVTSASGVDFTYRNGEEADQFTILESLGGGVALLDYDGDGLLDLFATGGGTLDSQQIQGRPSRLYRNLGAWKFRDVTGEVGLDGPLFYTHGCAVADYDRDGWPDLLVTGYGRLALYHNEGGDRGRRFVEVSERVGLHDPSWSSSAGWADLDGDGFPELYVCHYVDWSFARHPVCRGGPPGVPRDVCPPQRFQPLLHRLFHNEQGKAFRDVTTEQGLRVEGAGLGVLFVDVNDDGRPDVYVANDAARNLLYLNRGGKLEEKAELAGVAVDDRGVPNGSMGVDAGDYDGSGRASLWVTNYQDETHALYQNLGQERFHYQSRAAGITALGQRFVGFGTGFVDVDNDGWEDLFLVHGHVLRYPVASTHAQRPILLRNELYQGRRFFRDVAGQGGPFFQAPIVGRGVALGDLDNDGWPDAVVSRTNSPLVLLRNEAAAARPAQWLGVRLVGRGQRDVTGSTVTLEGASRRLTRFAKGGGSYLSASDPRLVFGLGEGVPIQRLTVRWAWGEVQHWDGLAPNRYWVLREGETEPQRQGE